MFLSFEFVTSLGSVELPGRRNAPARAWFLAAIFLLAGATCVQGQQEQPYAGLLDANTQFAFRFFRETVAKAPDKNVLTTPMALSLEFGLLQNGANQKAREQIQEVFEFNKLSPEEANHQSAQLLEALAPRQPLRPDGQRPVSKQLVDRRAFAASLWIRNGAFRQQFLQINKQFFKFSTARMPVRDKEAVAAINSWVARETGGRLEGIVESAEGDNFVLAYASYLKGAWIQPFQIASTHPGDFNLLSGAKKKVPMMTTTGQFGYVQEAEFQAIRLELEGSSVFVFLPDSASSLAEFEQLFTIENWKRWLPKMRLKHGSLELPKFRFAYQEDTKSILQDLGLVYPFNSFQAFAPLVTSPAGAKLTRILASSSLKVDEKGAEVVSSGMIGGVIGGVSAGPPPVPFRMIVNRPFLFVIIDQRTQSIVYVGAVVEP